MDNFVGCGRPVTPQSCPLRSGAHDALTIPMRSWLSPGDQAQCAQDLVNAARASFTTGQAHLAIAELTSWRETATAIAAGLSSHPVEHLERLDDAELVERP